MGNCLGTPQEVGGGAAAARPVTPAKLPSKPGTPAGKPGTPGSAVHVQAGGSGAQVAPAPTPAGPPRPDAAKMHQMRKRIAVAAEAISSAADIQIPVIPKTEYAERLIDKAIEGCLLFEQLSLPAKQAIIRSMKPKMVKAGEVVIKQGDTEASTFYVLERGAADVRIHKEEWGEERKVHTYQPGSSFGELALLYSAPRAATVVAAADSKLWVMERAVYTAIKRTDQENIAAEKRRLVDSVPLLAVLAPEHKAVVADGLEMVEFQAGQAIFEQGEAGDKFFIIREGTVVLTKDGNELARLTDGAYFGERALINAEPRAASATADGYVVCYALGRKAFNELLGPIEDVWRYETLRKVPILSNLSEQQLFQLAGRMANREFASGQEVFRKGEEGDTFYIVEEGTFSVVDGSNRELAKCGKGQCFGELALLENKPRAATVRASTPAKVLCCTRADFDHHLGSLAEIRNMWRFEALRKVPLLAPLTSQQRLALCTAFTTVAKAAGEGVIKKGEPGDTFYIIEEGSCVVVSDDGKELARLGPTAYFGERALLKNEPRAATVQAATDVRLLALGRDDFTRLLGPLQSLLESQAVAYDTPTSKISKALKLEDLKHVACLGAGAFGKVTLVQYDGKYYALKALSKAHVVQTGLQEHIKREKAVMAEFDSPFLVNLVAAFQDSHSLYMVMELVQGGEFFTYLQGRESPLTEDEARFYAGCVVLGLEYMHDRGIAWRDLKPENLLIDTQGYLKITDFGFAKKISPNGKTFTLCGTPEYLAPELVTQSGHSKAVDWCMAAAAGVLCCCCCCRRCCCSGAPARVVCEAVSSSSCALFASHAAPFRLVLGSTPPLCNVPLSPCLLPARRWAVGVLIYEMVAGYPPFYQEDRVAMFRAICSTDFKFPAHFSKELRDLVKRLLVRSTGRRLGCTSGGATEVKQHPWFKGFDWDALTQRKIKAPYVPKVNGPADASNFDAAQNTPSATRNSRYISTGVFKDF